MYKVMILIEPPPDPAAFEKSWPRFLDYAEAMPGLLRESHTGIEHTRFGHAPFTVIHELFFQSEQAAREAMDSPAGQAAGEVLQAITGGRMTLLLASHMEDDLENIKKFKAQEIEHDPPDTP